MSVKVIAEAGVNHNGDETLAFKLVDAAKKAGADVVKFQTFKAKNLVNASAKQADYQIKNTQRTESQLEMLRRLELSFDAHHRLIKYCNDIGIEFLSTAFDLESLDFLVNELKLTTLKLPSGEITNAPLILEHAKTQCELIVSTGMATLAEIELALGIIAFGYLNQPLTLPTQENFEAAYYSKKGQELLKERVTILHCTTEYPAPMEDINLTAMNTLAAAFNLPIGYSDHSEGISIPVAAVALGAQIIEKHFTLDKMMEGPDHKASLEPIELSEMVASIRKVEVALGDGLKGPRPSEIKNKAIVRKSLVANRRILKGEIFSSENLGIKRPGGGLQPINYWSLVGEKSEFEYVEGDLIRG